MRFRLSKINVDVEHNMHDMNDKFQNNLRRTTIRNLNDSIEYIDFRDSGINHFTLMLYVFIEQTVLSKERMRNS